MKLNLSNVQVLATTSFITLLGINPAFAEIYSNPELQNQKQYVAGEIDPDENQGAWVMAYTNHAKQTAKDLTPGFRAQTFGAGMGVDYRPMQPLLVGFGIRADYTDVDSYNYVGTNIDFTGTRLMAYSRYDLTSRWYVNAIVAYSFNEYNTNRNVYTFLGAGLPANMVEANGDIDGRQFTAEFNSGYQFSYDLWQLLPIVNIAYNSLRLNAYNEFGAGLSNLQYAKQSFESLKFSLDMVLAYQNEFQLAQLMPYIHFKVNYDTETDLEFSSDVFGGGTAFRSFGPTVPHTSYQTGAGFTLFGQGSVQVSMRYDYTFKHNYHDHGGVLYIRHEW